jgi:hypothetical protein
MSLALLGKIDRFLSARLTFGGSLLWSPEERPGEIISEKFSLVAREIDDLYARNFDGLISNSDNYASKTRKSMIIHLTILSVINNKKYPSTEAEKIAVRPYFDDTNLRSIDEKSREFTTTLRDILERKLREILESLKGFDHYNENVQCFLSQVYSKLQTTLGMTANTFTKFIESLDIQYL